jgi:phospholipid/cholesterol/gamma-HCH transport system substrate-binding protein
MSKGRDGFLGHLLTVAVFTAIFAGWVGFILHQAGVLPSFSKSYTLEADVPSAALLTPGARVTVAGVEVGSVRKIERSSDLGSGARLVMKITHDGVMPLPADSTLAIRTRSQVGEQYVSIDVGVSSRKLASGDTLASAQAEKLVDVDQILSVLSGPRREQARRLLRDTGLALDGRGKALNATLSSTVPVVRSGSAVVDVLHDQRATVAQLVDQLGRVTAAVGERGTAIQTIAGQGVTTLRAIGDRDAKLAATLRELPATLEQVKRATGTVAEVSDAAAPVVSNIAGALRDVRPAVRDLAPAAKDGRAVVASLRRANPALDTLLRSATAATKGLPEALPGVRSVFCQVNPALRYLQPYTHDVLQAAFHLGSASNSYDATGHLVRLVPIVNENSLSGAPTAVLDASRLLLQSGAFLPQKVINYDFYGKPGGIGTTSATGSGGKPNGPSAVPATGYKYPRITADC